MKICRLAAFAVLMQAIVAKGDEKAHRHHLRGKHTSETRKFRQLKKGEEQKWDGTKIDTEQQRMATQYGTNNPTQIPLGPNGLPDCTPNCYTQLQEEMLKDAAAKANEQATTKGYVDRTGGSVGAGGNMEVVDSFDVTTNDKQLHYTVYVVHTEDQQGGDKSVVPNRASLNEEITADEITRLPYNENEEWDRPVPGTEQVNLVLEEVVSGTTKEPDIDADGKTLSSLISGGGLPAQEYNRAGDASAGENTSIARCSVPTWNLSGSGGGHECEHDYDCVEGCCAATNQILGNKKCIPPDVNPAFNLICQGDVGNECVSSENRVVDNEENYGSLGGEKVACMSPKILSAENYDGIESFHHWRNCHQPGDCQSNICAFNPPSIAKGICLDDIPSGWRPIGGD